MKLTQGLRVIFEGIYKPDNPLLALKRYAMQCKKNSPEPLELSEAEIQLFANNLFNELSFIDRILNNSNTHERDYAFINCWEEHKKILKCIHQRLTKNSGSYDCLQVKQNIILALAEIASYQDGLILTREKILASTKNLLPANPIQAVPLNTEEIPNDDEPKKTSCFSWCC